MDEKFYLTNYEGLANASSINLAADTTVRLPDQLCKFAILSNWTVDDLSTFALKAGATSSMASGAATGSEVYYGFNGRIIAQLFAGASTILLPVRNLNEICARAQPGKTGVIWYAWFR